MSALVLLLWAANVALDTGGQLAFKTAAAGTDEAASGREHWRRLLRRPVLWVGLACYVLEFLAWAAFLSLVPLSRGVLLGSINIVALMLAGRWLFGEQLTPLRVAGIAAITLGVTLVGTAA